MAGVPDMADDPYLWNYDRVVHELCAPTGRLRSIYPHRSPDPVSFEDAIRQNHVDGEVMLACLDDAVLQTGFGIKSLGHRRSILSLLEQLRRESPGVRRRSSDRSVLPEMPDPESRIVKSLGSRETETTGVDKYGVTRRRLQLDATKVLPLRHGVDAGSRDGTPFAGLLKRWVNEPEDVLPLYGESGSENEYESSLLDEIEADIEEDRAKQTEQLSQFHLTTEEVSSIIEAALTRWRSQQDGRLERNASSFWSRSERNGTRHSQIEDYTTAIHRLGQRLATMKAEFLSQLWPDVEELKKVCKVMKPSVHDHALLVWKKNVLEKATAPVQLHDNEAGIGLAPTTSSDDEVEEGVEQLPSADDFSDVDDEVTDDASSDIVLGTASEHQTMSDTVAIPDTIDLTQLPSSPSMSENIGTAGPPTILGAPFRYPPTSKPYVDLYGPLQVEKAEFAETVNIAGLSRQEMEKVLTFGPEWLEIIEAAGDRVRLLTRIIVHSDITYAYKIATFAVSASKPQGSAIWPAIMTGQGQRIDGMSQEESDLGVGLIRAWFVQWDLCKFLDCESDIRLPEYLNYVCSRGELRFQEFWVVMFAVLQWLQQRKHPVSITSASKRRPQSLSSDEDESVYHVRANKRKKCIQPNKESADRRAQAQLRNKKREQMTHQLQLQHISADEQSGVTVVVNPSCLDERDALITMNPRIGSRLHDHQIEAVQFMWGEITAKDGQGCLLAHTMGLGKTLSAIALLVTLAEAGQNPNYKIRTQVPKSLRKSRTMILCPPVLIENWHEELLRWVPCPSETNVGKIRQVSSSLDVQDRLFEIQQWAQEGGILLISYTIFTDLVLNKGFKKQTPLLDQDQHASVSRQLIGRPSLIIADEAHVMKNESTGVHRAIKRLQSKKRIALTGSPLANNLEEFYSVIDFVAAGYLGLRDEFRAVFQKPIEDGLYKNAGVRAMRKSLKMLAVLKSEVAPIMHRAGMSVLKKALPGKTEFVLYVALSEVQQTAYDSYVRSVKNRLDKASTTELWTWLSVLKLLCFNPRLYRDKLLAPDMVRPGNESENGNGNRTQANLRLNASHTIEHPAEQDVFVLEAEKLTTTKSMRELGFTCEMIEAALQLLEPFKNDLDAFNPALSNKTMVLVQILDYSYQIKDKVLVFSHSIPSLDFVELWLKRLNRPYRRLDGSVPMTRRQNLCKAFNNADEPEVCLISTRVGGQGLNLQGANRVVIMDQTFNPMHEEQAIARAYRFGQMKHTFCYRIMVGGTFEEALHNQMLFKLQLATRVVDQKNTNRHALKGASQYLFPPRTIEQKDITPFLNKDRHVLDLILAVDRAASDRGDAELIRSIDLSETFLEEVEEALTAEELAETESLIRDVRNRRFNNTGDMPVQTVAPGAPLRPSESSAIVWEPIGRYEADEQSHEPGPLVAHDYTQSSRSDMENPKHQSSPVIPGGLGAFPVFAHGSGRSWNIDGSVHQEGVQR